MQKGIIPLMKLPFKIYNKISKEKRKGNLLFERG